MALLQRLSRLITADVHAVLDTIESPSTLIKQALREMESKIIEKDQQVDSLEEELNRIHASAEQLKHTIDAIDKDISLCFDNKNFELAKKTLKKKLVLEKRQNLLNQNERLIYSNKEREESLLKAFQKKYEEIEQEAELIFEQEKLFQTPSTTSGHASDSEWVVSEEELEIAFLKEKQCRERAGDKDE